MRKSILWVTSLLIVGLVGCGDPLDLDESGKPTPSPTPKSNSIPSPVPETLLNSIQFTPKKSVPRNTDIISDEITIAGISEPLVVRVLGNASFSIGDREIGSNEQDVVKNNDIVRVKLRSSDAFSTATEAHLQIGTATTTFKVTTSKPFVFPVNDGATGTELWVTDGSSTGTNLVENIGTNPKGSYPTKMTEYRGDLYFFADDVNHGNELHKFDLTSSELSLVKNIQSSGASRIHYPSKAIDIINDTMFFIANDELWISNGTAAGTQKLPLESRVFGEQIGILDERAYVVAGRTLWTSDGTQEGTKAITQFPMHSTDMPSQQFANFDGSLYFLRQLSTGLELWAISGVDESPRLVKMFEGLGQFTAKIVSMGSQLILLMEGNQGGAELHRSDGSLDGTKLVRRFTSNESIESEQGVIIAGSFSYFVINQDLEADKESVIWRTDGTESGTKSIRTKKEVKKYEAPRSLTAANDTVFFTAGRFSKRVLWSVSDSQEYASIIEKTGESASESRVGAMVEFDNKLMFSVDDARDKRSVWISDGTKEGTEQIIEDIEGGEGMPFHFFPAKKKVYFPGTIDGSGRELYETNGKKDNVKLVVDVNKSSTNGVNDKSYAPFEFIDLKGEKYFLANNNKEIRKLDGSSTRSKLIYGFEESVSIRNGPVATNGSIFFVVRESALKETLWKTDGTTLGTSKVKKINGIQSHSLLAGDSKVYFVASETSSGRELWVSDGSEAGTVRVKDIRPGPGSALQEPTFWESRLNQRLVSGDRIYFIADDGVTGKAIWVSDGTEIGTTRIYGDTPGESPSNFALISKQGSSLYAITIDAEQQASFVKIDLNKEKDALSIIKSDLDLCAEPGIRTDIYPFAIAWEDKTVFTFKCERGQASIWITDGTEKGTQSLGEAKTDRALPELVRIKDGVAWIESPIGVFSFSNGLVRKRFSARGERSARHMLRPRNLQSLDGILYFSAVTQEDGRELWRSDLTKEGTHLVVDLNKGSEDGAP